VDIWTATLSWIDHDGTEKQEHVALFYTKDRSNGEKNKDGNTGRMCLRELVRQMLVLLLLGSSSAVRSLFCTYANLIAGRPESR